MDKVLVLGGTNFIGRNLVDSLIKLKEFDATIVNRGITNPDLFPNTRKIKLDRNTSKITNIFKEKWDYIIDLSCYFPHSLAIILSALDKNIKRYILISTCSVYDNRNTSILKNEKSPMVNCNTLEYKDSTNKTYGNRKSECERLLIHSGIKYTILRPALVYGEYDSSDRFYYWLYHIKMKNRLVVPNEGEKLFSVTYVKDLVSAIIKVLTTKYSSSIYNIITLPLLSISKLIDVTSEILNIQPDIYFIDSEYLYKNKINQWTDLPLWLDNNHFTYDNTKMITQLKIEATDFKKSVTNTIGYYNNLGWEKPRYGMSDDIRKKLIDGLS